MDVEELLQRYAAGEKDFVGIDLQRIDVGEIDLRRRLGGAERNPTDYQDVGLRKASTQPTIFLQSLKP